MCVLMLAWQAVTWGYRMFTFASFSKSFGLALTPIRTGCLESIWIWREPAHRQAVRAGAGSGAAAAPASASQGMPCRLTACGSAQSGKHAGLATECGSARCCSGTQSSAYSQSRHNHHHLLITMDGRSTTHIMFVLHSTLITVHSTVVTCHSTHIEQLIKDIVNKAYSQGTGYTYRCWHTACLDNIRLLPSINRL